MILPVHERVRAHLVRLLGGLYSLAENLSGRAAEFAARLTELTGASAKDARAEFDLAVERLAQGSLGLEVSA